MKSTVSLDSNALTLSNVDLILNDKYRDKGVSRVRCLVVTEDWGGRGCWVVSEAGMEAGRVRERVITPSVVSSRPHKHQQFSQSVELCTVITTNTSGEAFLIKIFPPQSWMLNLLNSIWILKFYIWHFKNPSLVLI